MCSLKEKDALMARMNRCSLRKSQSKLYFDNNFLSHREQITKDSVWFAKHRCLVTFGKSQDASTAQHFLLRRGWFSYISCLLSPTLCVCLEYPRKSEISFMSLLSKPIQASKILIPCSASTELPSIQTLCLKTCFLS